MSNFHYMNNKQRYLKAFLYGLLTAIISGIVVAYLNQLTAALAHISFPIVYLASGYAIAKAIHQAGGGIDKSYAYLGAGLTVFSILISEMCYYMGYAILLHPLDWIPALKMIFALYLQINQIISLLFMIFAVYIGYHESVIGQH